MSLLFKISHNKLSYYYAKQKKKLPPRSLVDNSVKGEISQRSTRRLVETIYNMYNLLKVKQSCKKTKINLKMIFVTLTLASEPIGKTDKEVKQEMLMGFFTELQRYLGTQLNFIWRAEVTPEYSRSSCGRKRKNESFNRLHFHIIFDRFIPRSLLTSIWLKVQERWKLVSSCKSKRIIAVDVQCVRDAKASQKYLAKYVGKHVKGVRMVEGRLWGCSKSLKNIQVDVTCEGNEQVLSKLRELGKELCWSFEEEKGKYGVFFLTENGIYFFRQIIDECNEQIFRELDDRRKKVYVEQIYPIHCSYEYIDKDEGYEDIKHYLFEEQQINLEEKRLETLRYKYGSNRKYATIGG